MYTVHVRETSGRPWLAALIAATALGLTVIAAAQLASRHHGNIKLGPRVRLPRWPVTFCVPDDFKSAVDDDDVRSSETLLFDEQRFERKPRKGPRVGLGVVFRTMRKNTPPEEAISRILSDYYETGNVRVRGLPSFDEADGPGGRIAIGPYEGRTLRFAILPGDRAIHIACAITPRGQAIAVIVDAAGMADAQLYALLEAVCESIEPVGGRD